MARKRLAKILLRQKESFTYAAHVVDGADEGLTDGIFVVKPDGTNVLEKIGGGEKTS